MKRKDILDWVLVGLALAVFGFFLAGTILAQFFPEILDKLTYLLTRPPSIEELEKVEPVRGKIAFEVRGRIYIMNVDGSNLTELIDGKSPAFSPDGKKIAFAKETYLGSTGIEIYVISARGGTPIQLTSDRSRLNEYPAWSPDGKKIAFASALKDTRPTRFEIYVINVDGTGLMKLTEIGETGPRNPAWSPDGKKIAFSARQGGTFYIYLMNADGSNLTRLIEGDYPSWSPDGKKIAFAAWYGGEQIFVINADGSNLRRLTFIPDAQNGYPSWSPDGKKIAFVSKHDDMWHLYVMNADGSNLTRLTENKPFMRRPTWSPP